MTQRKRSAIIHIGTEKTGTTSIQNVMMSVRDQLPPLGFAYPSSPGNRNHLRLAMYAADTNRTKGMVKRTRKGPDPAEIGTWFPEMLTEEMEALPDSTHTVIFSNEHLHSRLVSAPMIQRLKDLLDRFFDEYTILVYLRRQDELAASRFSTMIRTGGYSPEVLPMHLTSMLYFDYASLLERWVEVFGRSVVKPRLFAREHFLQGDLMLDFFAACGLPLTEYPAERARSNPSIHNAAQEFLMRFNRSFERVPGQMRPPWIGEFMNSTFAGKGRSPSRETAIDFCAAFNEQNERVRSEFFPDREALFSDDYSRYPEAETPAPTDTEVLDVTMRVIAYLSATVERRSPRGRAQGKAVAAVAAGDQPPESLGDLAAMVEYSEEDEEEEAAHAAHASLANSAPPPAAVPEGDPRAGYAAERLDLLRKIEEEPTSLKALRRLVRVSQLPQERAEANDLLERAIRLAPGREDLTALLEKVSSRPVRRAAA